MTNIQSRIQLKQRHMPAIENDHSPSIPVDNGIRNGSDSVAPSSNSFPEEAANESVIAPAGIANADAAIGEAVRVRILVPSSIRN